MNPYRGEDEPSCPRYESEELFNRELGLPPSEHVKTCPSCSALAEKYRRLDRAIVDLGADARPAGDWQAKVRARILNDRPRQRERSRNPILFGVAIASALASAGAVAYVSMRSNDVAAPAKPAPIPHAPITPAQVRPVKPIEPVEAVEPAPVETPTPLQPMSKAKQLEGILAGYPPIRSGRYTLYNRRLDYEVAQLACELDGAHLVTIETAKENAALRALAAKAEPTVYGWKDVRIGVDDLQEQGVYRWPRGSKATYVNWSPGEPNHGTEIDNGAKVVEHCAVYKGSTPEAVWDDRPCSFGYPFICEREPK